MAFDFESLGRDWAISLTDLVLALVAYWACSNVAGGKVTFDFHSDSNLIALGYASVGFAAFLGFIRWGFFPNIKFLNKTYGYSIELSKVIGVPFLIAQLIQQNYVTKTQIFGTLTAYYLVSKLARLDSNWEKNISQIITILPLVLVAFDGFINQNIFKLMVFGGFLSASLAMEKSGVPLFHLVLAVVMWLLECARTNSYVNINLPFFN